VTTFLYAISKKRTRSENCMHFCEGTGLKIAHRFARGVAGRSIIPDFWQVGVALKPEGLLLQTSHRAWPPEGRCI